MRIAKKSIKNKTREEGQLCWNRMSQESNLSGIGREIDKALRGTEWRNPVKKPMPYWNFIHDKGRLSFQRAESGCAGTHGQPLEQGWSSFFCKKLDIKYFKLCGSYCLCHNYIVLPLQFKSSHRQHVNEWLYLFF